MDSPMKKAIVTLAIGDEYKKLFDQHARNNWQTYCDAFGYDLIVLTESLDPSERAQKRSPAWQKLLILSQPWSQDYDRIVWIDTDVIINSSYAYDICDGVPEDKVGAVEAYSIPTSEIHHILLDRQYKMWAKNKTPYLDNSQPHSYYTNRGILGDDLMQVVQTGVFVCSPIFHREIFEYIYEQYEDTHGAEWNYEMPAMSYELVRADLVHWISPRFNFCVMDLMAAFYPEILTRRKSLIQKIIRRLMKELKIPSPRNAEVICLKNIYDLSICMHFAGCSDKMPAISRYLKA